MTSLYSMVERPDLEAPVLIMVLKGWIDAGLGAQQARDALLQVLETVTVATFDTYELLDHRARRPTMHLADGVLTGVSWPSIELRAATDFDGNVWGVGFSSSNAYRIDVPTQTIDAVGGLVAAYTYSDMTGFALAAAGVPSG